MIHNGDQGNETVWGLIWKSKIHERLKLFLWRLASNILLVNVVLVSRMGKGEVNCSLCGQSPEEVMHLFRECSISRSFAFASKWSLRLDAIPRASPKDFVQNILHQE